MINQTLRILILILIITISTLLRSKVMAQNDIFLSPEISFGISAASNEEFPDRNIQWQGLFHIATSNTTNTQEWARRLNAPLTGLSLGYTNFGNNQELGSAYSLMPFLEFKNFKSNRWTTQLSLGASYFTTAFDFDTNFDNRAVSTDFTWSFRAFTHYTFLEGETINWRLGVGLFHHSNGHMRLPNNGFNSFLMSVSAQINKPIYYEKQQYEPLTRSRYNYFTIRKGIGQNVLNDGFPFNNKKEVYTVSGEVGRVYNNTIRIGIGGFYRFYEHYYDYINDNEFVVRDGERFENLRSQPWKNASNIALYTRGELLLNHIGIEVLIGVNLFKPAYDIDWYLNEGWDFVPREIPDYWVFGEFNSKYKLKKLFNTRIGLNYYLKGTQEFTPHNFTAGIHINTNLGQADFTEVSIGYVYSFGN